MMSHETSEVHHQDSSLDVERREMSKGKTPIMEAALIGKKAAIRHPGGPVVGATRIKRGVSIVDFVLRLFTLVAALAATITMGTTEQTLPFFTQFFQFRAKYYDLPTFTYFVIANGAVSAYLVLSLPFSIVTISRPLAKAPRLLLLTLDTIAMTLTTSAAAAAAAIVYLAHKGNVNTNWIAICSQFDRFCQRSSGAVVASFTAAALLIVMIVVSTIALKSH